MHKLRTKLSNAINQTSNPTLSQPNPSARQPTPPTTLDILRHRTHHGTNLGSIFVLEKWLFPSLFEPSAHGDSELDAIAASVAAHGLDATRSRWERHWSTALSDSDIEWLARSAGIECVRVPIGHFTLGAAFATGTPFQPYQAVYATAWPAVLSLCARLYRIGGIAVLLDLHALPGGANDQDHSGTASHSAELWGSAKNLKLAKECAVFVAKEVSEGRVEACVGVQVCNEACWGAGNKGMWKWCEGVVDAVSAIDATIPILVSDAWELGEAMAWCQKMNGVKETGRCPVGVASSKYFCFSEGDKSKSPQQIIEQVERREMEDVNAAGGDVLAKGAVEVFVTEWSCALDLSTWGKAPDGDRDSLVNGFGQAQARRWKETAGGAWFWTAKMEWMDGGEWGLFEMVKKGAVAPASHLIMDFEGVRESIERAKVGRDKRKRENVGAHIGYWTQTAPKGKFEHWRFERAWNLGFEDAMAFFEARAAGFVKGARRGGDTIGALELWILKRLREGGGEWWGDFAWEWEHGFRQGVAAFESFALAGV